MKARRTQRTLDALLAGYPVGTWVVLDPGCRRLWVRARTPAGAMRKAHIPPTSSGRAVGKRPVMLQVPDLSMACFFEPSRIGTHEVPVDAEGAWRLLAVTSGRIPAERHVCRSTLPSSSIRVPTESSSTLLSPLALGSKQLISQKRVQRLSRTRSCTSQTDLTSTRFDPIGRTSVPLPSLRFGVAPVSLLGRDLIFSNFELRMTPNEFELIRCDGGARCGRRTLPLPGRCDDGGVTGAETTAAFLLERVRAARGPLWDEGRGRVPAPGPPSGPALQTFAERRVRGVPEDVVRGLFAWDRGERPVDLLFEVPAARRVLALQARGAAMRLPARGRGGARARRSAPPGRAGVRAPRPLPPGEVRRARTSRRPGRVLPPRRARAGDARDDRPRRASWTTPGAPIATTSSPT